MLNTREFRSRSRNQNTCCVTRRVPDFHQPKIDTTKELLSTFWKKYDVNKITTKTDDFN